MPLAERFFRFLLRRDDPSYADSFERPPARIGDPALRAALAGEPATAWYSQGLGDSAIVAAAVGIEARSGSPAGGGARIGAVLIEQASDSVLTTTNAAMMRLMSTTVLVSLIAAAALLAYASFLSFRVGRLARAAESALGPRGEINARFPGTRAGDEIGDLSRSFEGLLGRLREYTDYLKTLKSKLSHELRTPLAIVSTSLDNLEHEPASESAKAYRARLRHGVERLESIMQAMTAATRVEQAITQNETERFDLARVVASCQAAYGDVYPARRFAASLPPEAVVLEGSAELVEQMLDKLIDNAVGFAVPATAVEIDLVADEDEARLSVTNKGPLLPERMRHQLFDSLVSVREAQGDKPHLGLGLYIVTLVAEFHGGRVEADNLPDASGVMVSVILPRRRGR
jgi:signal transduction histidine kinase